MAAYFIDLDGTFFRHSTNEPLPGALQEVRRLYEAGHQIIFTTRRGDLGFGDDHQVYSRKATYAGLRQHDVPYHHILFDIDSPRIVINDDGCGAINWVTNQPVSGNGYGK